jgi:excisionase family DNA binding protein
MSATATRPRYIPIKEAAERFGVHENTIRNWIDRNVLRAYRLPSGVRRLPVEEVERLERDLFAVPTSFFDPAVTRAPKSARSEPITSKLP